jgi:putative dehydrogenase
METVAIIAQGEMGAGVGRRLVERGARVLTSLRGRSPASAERAGRAGMVAVEDDAALIEQSDFFLSIVPPGDAVTLAERMKPALARATRKPVYIDCNAVAPDTAERIGAVLADTGCRYVDAGIIGGPPSGASPGPRFYASGEAAGAMERLARHGLSVRVIDGPVGAASALKMSYAGITKGTTAIGAAMMLGASRAGCAAALREELADSQPQMLAWLASAVSRMPPKAYRWVAEMEEIGDFLGQERAEHDVYAAIARFYQRLAHGMEKLAEGDELAALEAFCAGPDAKATRRRA